MNRICADPSACVSACSLSAVVQSETIENGAFGAALKTVFPRAFPAFLAEVDTKVAQAADLMRKVAKSSQEELWHTFFATRKKEAGSRIAGWVRLMEQTISALAPFPQGQR